MEPLESLRYAAWLSPDGAVVSAAEPLVNIPDYPEISGVIKSIESFPVHRIVEAEALAREAGLARSVNMVMVGAASVFLPIGARTLEETIKEVFLRKDKAVVEANIKAFTLGRNAAK
jgi:Pyruvate/2-oxoacid:ferredoxin oxidoreductase gamma subunit